MLTEAIGPRRSTLEALSAFLTQNQAAGVELDGDQEPPPQAASLSSAHKRPEPRLEVAAGGSYLKLTMPTGERFGGGKRGAVSDFTHASRLRLLSVLNKIDRRQVEAGRVRLVTLTYPGQSDEHGQAYITPRDSKAHLAAIVKRFRRAWGANALIWKLEPQKRGAPHYHLMAFMPSADTLEAEQAWWAQAWFEVVGTDDPKHLAWHLGKLGNGNRPCVEQIRTWQGVMSYAGKYLCKPADCEAWEHPGRWWGVYSRDQLPTVMLESELSREQALSFKRMCVKLYNRMESGKYRVEWERSEGMRRASEPPGRRRRCVHRLFLKPHEVHRHRSHPECSIRPIYRKWRGRGGGCRMFIQWETAKRLMEWLKISTVENSD